MGQARPGLGHVDSDSSCRCFRIQFFCFSQVKLGEAGYKERYYAEKFGVSTPEEIDKVRSDTVSSHDSCVAILIKNRSN